MKLSIDTFGVSRRIGNEKAIEVIKNAGFDAYDHSFFSEHFSEFLESENYIEYYTGLRKLTDKLNFECNQAHAPFDLKYGTNFSYEEKPYRAVARSIECAAILGAKCIVVHSLHAPEDIDIVEYNTKYYKSLEPYAQKSGIKIAVENLFEYDPKRRRFNGRLETPEKLTDFIKSLNSDYFTACVDVGHVAVTGSEPENFISKMDSNLLTALHIHDTTYTEDNHMLPYFGRHNWDKICEALKTIGYSGDITFENSEFAASLSDDLIPDALKLAERIGRKLIDKIERK